MADKKKSGIERLRDVYDDFSKSTLGGWCNDVANQIERERAEEIENAKRGLEPARQLERAMLRDAALLDALVESVRNGADATTLRVLAVAAEESSGTCSYLIDGETDACAWCQSCGEDECASAMLATIAKLAIKAIDGAPIDLATATGNPVVRCRNCRDERDAAADWVEAHGGLDAVINRIDLFADMLNRVDSIIAGDEQHCFGEHIDLEEARDLFEVMHDRLDKRLMPEGMEWPRFEDGEKVEFGSCVDGLGDVAEKFVFTRSMGGVCQLQDKDGRMVNVMRGERVKRQNPEVLGADGLPIRKDEK